MNRSRQVPRHTSERRARAKSYQTLRQGAAEAYVKLNIQRLPQKLKFLERDSEVIPKDKTHIERFIKEVETLVRKTGPGDLERIEIRVILTVNRINRVLLQLSRLERNAEWIKKLMIQIQNVGGVQTYSVREAKETVIQMDVIRRKIKETRHAYTTLSKQTINQLKHY